MSISNNTMSELANSFIATINIESINLKSLLMTPGLSKSAVKELLNELVDRCADNIDKPSFKKEESTTDVLKSTLVNEYGLTYSVVNRLIDVYNIEFPEQLKYLSDSELRHITGIGESTLRKIRSHFAYEEPQSTRTSNLSIGELNLPTKIEEILRENNVLTIKQLETFVSEDIENIGYPMCIVIQEAYDLYVSGETEEREYYKKYLDILLQSFTRNLNNLIRHSSTKLNLHWINESLYQFVTYTYEIMFKDSKYVNLFVERCASLSKAREELLSELYYSALDDNPATIRHYQDVLQMLKDIYSVFAK